MTKRIKLEHGRRYRRGMVLVVALLIMAIMSIIGAAAITTSRIDIQISNNTKLSRQAFYAAEGGIEQMPKYVGDMVVTGQTSAVPTYVNLSGDIMDEITAFTPCALCDQADWVHSNQTGAAPGGPNGPDMWVPMPGGHTVMVDVDRIEAKHAPGSGVEFLMADAGAGGGTQGGVHIFYDIHSVDLLANVPQAYIDVLYRYVVGVAGGK